MSHGAAGSAAEEGPVQRALVGLPVLFALGGACVTQVGDA